MIKVKIDPEIAQSRELQHVEVKSLKQLHQWLSKNHTQSESVWLITFKKSVPKFYIEYSEIVDELLCFGWIDSLPKKLDANRKMLRISPRNPKSAWSKINRDKVTRLLAAKRIRKPGLKAIEQAKRNGSWEILKKVDSNLVPDDLEEAFAEFPRAKENFAAFPHSSRRGILEWIALSKTPITRKKRIQQTAQLAAKNIRANHSKPF